MAHAQMPKLLFCCCCCCLVGLFVGWFVGLLAGWSVVGCRSVGWLLVGFVFVFNAHTWPFHQYFSSIVGLQQRLS